MGETMTEMAMDDNASYVLTEDMIDAAMNQQLSYQDDMESEECSQGEENMVTLINSDNVNQSSVESTDSLLKDTTPTGDSAKYDNTNDKPPECDSPSTSVLVIETGLNSNISLDGNSSTDSNDDVIQVLSSSHQDCSTNSAYPNTSWLDSVNNRKESIQSTNAHKSETNLTPMLANMLNDTPTIFPIAICEEDTSSETSENEMMEQELVDSELQSVMQSNLMAEVGIPVNTFAKEGDQSTKDPLQAPKISVKSISHISASDFESMPESSPTVDPEALQNNSSQLASAANTMIKVSKEINELKPMSLHLNKIAVPNNETFVNKQGEKMRCVYLQTSNEIPTVPFKRSSPPVLCSTVNSSQVTNKNPIPSSTGIYTPPTRKPIVISASTNNRMRPPNVYQSHRLIPIAPHPTTTKPNLKLISTLQRANFRGPNVYAASHNTQSWQKSTAVSTDNKKEIYIPDVLLAPEHIKNRIRLSDLEPCKVTNIHKPSLQNVYSSSSQETSSLNGSLVSDSGQKGKIQNAQRQTIQKQTLVSNPNSSLIPTLHRPPVSSISRPNTIVAHNMSTQTVYQYDSLGMDSIIKTLLFHNLKKPYVPPETHPCMEKITYNCADCSDRFIFEKNLAEHLARKTVLIRYMCKLCNTEIHFYNRCLLFKHLRMHNNSIKDLDTSCIKISDLPKALIDKGIVSSCFKHNVNQVSLQKNERVLKNSKYGQWQATDPEINKPYKSSVFVDKDTQQKIIIPTVKFPQYNKRNVSTSVSPVVASSTALSPVVTSTNPTATTLVPLQKLATGVLTPSFTPVAVSSPMLTPITPVAHSTYNCVVPTTNNSTNVNTPSAYSPFIQKLPNNFANQLKCASARSQSNSLLINKSQTHNLTSAQSSKVIFLSKVKPPTTNLVQPVQTKEPKSILKAPARENLVQEQVNQKSTTARQHIAAAADQAQQSNNINKNITQASKDDMIIDIDVDKVIQNLEEEVVDVESVWVDNGNDSSNNTVNGKRTSKSIITKTYKRNCSECGVSCLNIAKHLNGNNRPSSNPAMECQTCRLILPTRCALKIHDRIHSQTQPYKCPDCGKDFTAWSEFYSHLKYSCGHLAKCIRFLCISCKEHFPTREILGNHMKSKHSRDVYKCQFCPVAFYSIDALQKHTPEKHPEEECILQTHHKQCSICTKKVVPLEKFNAHMEHHITSSNIMVYGYKCPMCTLTYSNKMAFVIHQIKEKTKSVYGPEKKKAPTKSPMLRKIVDVEEVTSEVCQNTGRVSLADSDEPTIDTYHDSDEVEEKDPLSLDDCEVQKIKKEAEELCIICKKTYIAPNSKSSCCENCVSHLSGPISLDESTKSFSLSPMQNQDKPCPKSKKRSLSNDETNQNFESKRPKSIISMSRSSSISSENEMCSFSSALDTENPTTKKKSRKKPNKQSRKGQDEGQIMSSFMPAQYTCSKCENFIGSSREDFLEHIKGHRTEPNSYQCLECGLCFVVLPSLERHLQMYHQIKDVTNYVKENNACMPQKTIHIEEKRDLQENQCPVCGDVFETQLIFEKHFRVHGRAFMSTLKK